MLEKIKKISYKEIIKPKIKKEKLIKTIKLFVDITIIFKIFQNFFCSNQLSQYMDETNPLSEITQKRKICLFTSGASNRNSISVREIQPSQYGRICPIETPEGQNTGLISSLTVGARINKIGIIESPFYKIKNKIKNYKIKNFFLSPEQEEKTTISNDLIFKKQNKTEEYFSIKKNQDFGTTNKINKINFIGISPLQMISIATSLIPFLEHNDANRVLMGSNMQRQAVPILNPENPIVGTGLELETARDNGTIILAKKSGIIIETNSKFITIKSMQTINKIKLIEIKNYWKKFSSKLKFQ